MSLTPAKLREERERDHIPARDIAARLGRTADWLRKLERGKVGWQRRKGEQVWEAIRAIQRERAARIGG